MQKVKMLTPNSKVLGLTLLNAYRLHAEHVMSGPCDEKKAKELKRLKEIKNLIGITGNGKYWSK